MRSTTSSLAAAGGTSLFLRTWSSDDGVREKAVVLLVHGYAEHSGRYEHVARSLTDAGYGVATYDLRGHGRSSGARATVRAFRDHLGDLRRAHRSLAESHPGLPVVLLGHSMGGAIALHYVLRDQRDLAALVLSGPYLRGTAAVPPALRAAAAVLGRVLPGLPVQALDSADVSRDEEVVRAYDSDPLTYRGKVKARMGWELLRLEAPVFAGAARITLPVLIVHGALDRLADPGASRELFDRLGSDDKHLEVYDGLFHEVFNEPEKERVLGDVVTWLDARVPTARV